MLKKILSVSGKPGLFKLISEGKNMFIVESLIDHKRIPVYMRDKVVSLKDISVYTAGEELSLSVVLNKIKEKENGQAIDYNPAIKPEELRAYLETIVPDFDKERVYPSDIKKMMSWYNLLLKEGLTDFVGPEEEAKEEEENKEKEKSNL
ncbi:MAG: DUF5606 domain-containing protein [Dysgonamonadaceae bacterium]|jgi:hypothetical protein|nr:DUF5606 domain-containing protein [Dysgonamonadaceae bacterium]